MTCRVIAVSVFTIALLPTVSAGQTVTEQGLRPVDATVEDLDPLQRSMRVVQPGLRTTGDASVFQPLQPGEPAFAQPRDQRLFFINQGFVASFDRSEYAVQLRTGTIFAGIPPNTVFHLSPPVTERPHSQQPDSPYRIDGRVRESLSTPPPPAATSNDNAPDDSADDNTDEDDGLGEYYLHAAYQLSLVIASLQPTDRDDD